jgi:hypothetical protein
MPWAVYKAPFNWCCLSGHLAAHLISQVRIQQSERLLHCARTFDPVRLLSSTSPFPPVPFPFCRFSVDPNVAIRYAFGIERPTDLQHFSLTDCHCSWLWGCILISGWLMRGWVDGIQSTVIDESWTSRPFDRRTQCLSRHYLGRLLAGLRLDKVWQVA